MTIFHPLDAGAGHPSRHRDVRGRPARVTSARSSLPLRPPASFALDPFVPAAAAAGRRVVRLQPARVRARPRRRRLRRVRRGALVGRLRARPLRRRDAWRRASTTASTATAAGTPTRASSSRRRRGTPQPPPRATARARRACRPDGRVGRSCPDDAARTAYRARRVVFLGHLVTRPGRGDLPRRARPARRRRCRRDRRRGPLEHELRGRAPSAVTLPRLRRRPSRGRAAAGEASVAVAPYAPESLHAVRRPGKAEGVLSPPVCRSCSPDVPPNAGELEREAGAEIVAVRRLARWPTRSRAAHASPEQWQARRDAALAYARRFDWNTLFDDLLREAQRDRFVSPPHEADQVGSLAVPPRQAARARRPATERKRNAACSAAQEQRGRIREHEHEPDRPQRSTGDEQHDTDDRGSGGAQARAQSRH